MSIFFRTSTRQGPEGSMIPLTPRSPIRTPVPVLRSEPDFISVFGPGLIKEDGTVCWGVVTTERFRFERSTGNFG